MSLQGSKETWLRTPRDAESLMRERLRRAQYISTVFELRTADFVRLDSLLR